MRTKETLLPYCISAFITFSAPCLADSKDELAHRFVEVLRYEQQLQQSHDACLSAIKQVTPEALVAATPMKFGGIQPSSMHWPKIIKAYESYYRKMCSRPTRDEYLNALAASYSKMLSEAELRQAITFYSSEVGQKLVPAHKAAASDLNNMALEAMKDMATQALVELDNQINEAVELQNAKPLKNAL